MRFAEKLLALVLSLFFICSASLSAQTVSAAPTAAPQTDSPRPKVAVVLSGGGAKGFAHVALLEALEEEGIPIDLITGTSMGSMIGSLYASGYSAKEIRQIISSNDMMELILEQATATTPLQPEAFDLTKGNLLSYPVSMEGVGAAPGLVGDQKILTFMGRLLSKNYNIETFDDLPIPYRAVGTDVITFTPYVFEQGSLLKAVRGSMSLPMLFTPAPTGTGRWVMDGGLVNNLPVQLARQLGADIIIACDVASNLPEDTQNLKTAFDMGIHLFNFFISPNALAQHDEADLLITPDLQPYNTLSFMFPEEIMEKGDEAIAQERSAIHEIALQLEAAGVTLDPKDPDRISVYAQKKSPIVESVVIEDVSAGTRIPLPKTATYNWLVGNELTDSAMNRLVTQLKRDRDIFNLSSLCFETRAGSTPETCTLVLVANHYDRNPGNLGLGGSPELVSSISNGQVTGLVFPNINLRLHLDEPFSRDYFGSIGPSITAGFTTTPQFASISDVTLHADTGFTILNGGLSPDTAYSWFNKLLLDDTGINTHLGIESRYLQYSTARTGLQYTLYNTTTGIIQSAAGYGNVVINSLNNPVSGWSGLRIDGEGSYGIAVGDENLQQSLWGVSYRQIQMFSLVPEKTSIGYLFSVSTNRGPSVLADCFSDYGGTQGMCGYPAGTLVRDFALAGFRYQTKLASILGMPCLLQCQLKIGACNPDQTTYSLSSFLPVDAGYDACILLDSPVGNITAGLSHSVTNKKICIMLGIR